MIDDGEIRRRRRNGARTVEYRKFMAIVDKTRMTVVLVSNGSGLWLTAKQKDKVLASVPFDPCHPDAAAHDLARRLTLDGTLPPGMSEI